MYVVLRTYYFSTEICDEVRIMEKTLHNEEAHKHERGYETPHNGQRADDALLAYEKHVVGGLLQGTKPQID